MSRKVDPPRVAYRLQFVDQRQRQREPGVAQLCDQAGVLISSFYRRQPTSCSRCSNGNSDPRYFSPWISCSRSSQSRPHIVVVPVGSTDEFNKSAESKLLQSSPAYPCFVVTVPPYLMSSSSIHFQRDKIKFYPSFEKDLATDDVFVSR